MLNGRCDIFYLLDDLHRVSGDKENSRKYVDLLKKHSFPKTKVVSWDYCLKRLTEKLQGCSFDVSIGMGKTGNLISNDLKDRGIKLGSLITFYVTRLSNHKWEKIAYMHTPGHQSLDKQAKEIKKIIINAKNIAIIDDVTYSGGTRKILEKIIANGQSVTAVDLVTIKSAKKINNYNADWVSGICLSHDPYPTTNSKRQVDVMNVSEFIYPSKIIGKILKGKVDDNKVLWKGDVKVLRKVPYTDNNERNTVYFGKHGKHIQKETRKIQKKLKSIYR